MEAAAADPTANYALGSVLNHVLLVSLLPLYVDGTAGGGVLVLLMRRGALVTWVPLRGALLGNTQGSHKLNLWRGSVRDSSSSSPVLGLPGLASHPAHKS